MSDNVLEVTELIKHFEIRKGFLDRVHGHVRAVDGVTFSIRRGETFGLVGESGCGKTTIGRTIMRALDPTSGHIRFSPAEADTYELSAMTRKDLREVRPRIQMVFQDPFSSLSPRMTIKDIIAEPAWIHRMYGQKESDARVAQLLDDVGLRPQYMTRYPHAFSGGQRQRIGFARALMTSPDFIVADEPVSALDVSVQAQILELMVKLREQYSLSYLFISHDLSVVRYICHRIGVMYVGKLFEFGDTEDVFRTPRHPYTESLLAAVPDLDPATRDTAEILGGEVADAANPPSGCFFHPRCKYARDRCRVEAPALRSFGGADKSPHRAACHFSEELDLQGVR